MSGFNFVHAGATNTRPPNAAQTVPGTNWMRGPDEDIRTKLTATDLNRLKANLENLVTGLGGMLDGSDNMLIDALLGYVEPFSKYDASGPPTPTDDSANTSGRGHFKQRSNWYDINNSEIYKCIDDTPGAAVWVPLSLTLDELGSAATLNAGLSANNLLQLDGAGKLPAIDGSQLTNLPSTGGVTDHAALTGLGGDDHTQYHNDDRGDARYYTQAQVDAAISAAVAAVGSPISAFAHFDGTGVITIKLSDNIASITDNSTGIYTLNFDEAMDHANYLVLVSKGVGGAFVVGAANDHTAQTVNSCKVTCRDTSGTYTDITNISVIIVGGKS